MSRLQIVFFLIFIFMLLSACSSRNKKIWVDDYLFFEPRNGMPIKGSGSTLKINVKGYAQSSIHKGVDFTVTSFRTLDDLKPGASVGVAVYYGCHPMRYSEDITIKLKSGWINNYKIDFIIKKGENQSLIAIGRYYSKGFKIIQVEYYSNSLAALYKLITDESFISFEYKEQEET